VDHTSGEQEIGVDVLANVVLHQNVRMLNGTCVVQVVHQVRLQVVHQVQAV
jgi:hypothetical protein